MPGSTKEGTARGVAAKPRRGRVVLPLLAIAFGAVGAAAPAPAKDGRKHLHYAVNLRGDYAGAASAGFNLADISTPAALDALPEGMKGVYWLGNGYKKTCAWRLSDEKVTAIVRRIKNHPKFSGIYRIADEPHPALCPDAPQRVAERTALIHALDPNGKTFVGVLNNHRAPTEFAQLKDSADYIGVHLYPCNRKNETTGCNFAGLRAKISSALAAGIPKTRIVPVFQAFGQSCTTDPPYPPYYRLPTVAETEAMLAVWDEMLPAADRPFDMTYTWGQQPKTSCPTLQNADGKSFPDLRSVFAQYFARLESSRHAEH